METAETIARLVIALLSVTCGVLGVMLQRKTERIKIVERQLSERKSAIYADWAEFFYGMLKNVKQGKPFDAVAAQDAIYRLKREILVFGSDDVFRRFNDRLCPTGTNGDGSRQMICLMELLPGVEAGHLQRPHLGDENGNTDPYPAKRTGGRRVAENMGCEMRYFRKTIKI
ncbi:hypothetical protein [uncultured Alistipes sp.]|uniref:hypothetical protein n=1 Tax=uncultured Alistipes sp. TaxID=538949 RepID=UPI002624033B|nr:hypothetical protein [uncultured Alistipes sp.]